MNRRKFVIGSGTVLLTPALLPLSGMSQSKPDAPIGRPYNSEMPDMLVSYLSKELNDLAFTWDKKRALLTTAEDVETRNAFVKKSVVKMLGGFPEKNPLGAVTVKTIQRDGYRIENVMFQSRPDFWVTGNLYVPTTGNGPFPGIISPCGHYPLARMVAQYQSAYISLVKSGFVVMAFDPIGQGERRQYWNPETGVNEMPSPTYEHSMPGQLQLLLGENLTEYRVWDAMRAIDYLLTRPEVDPKKIGCAGHSGGGSMTTVISVVDDRIRCAAIIEGGMINRWPQKFAPWQPIGPSDVEQNLFPAAIYGIDEIDLHTAIAPRPVLTAVEHDGPTFDKAAQSVRARYRQLGATEKFGTVAADDPHSWSPKLRMATTDWFCRWFYDRKGPQTEQIFKTEPPENLYCTPNGSIRYSRKGRTIFSLILDKQASLPPERSMPKTSAERDSYQETMRADIRKLLHYRKSDQALDVRSIVTTPREGYRIEKVQFLSEPGIYIPTWVYIPKDKTGVLPTILYVSDQGFQRDGLEFGGGEEGAGSTHGVLDTLVRAGNLVVAVDVRGIGETRPPHPAFNSCSEFGQLFDLETAMAYMAWFMDESLLGMRVQDVVRSVDYVMSRKEADTTHLHVIGKGMGGMLCLYAAALDPRIRSLISVQSLLSYRSLTETDRYLYGADVFVPNVLLHFDLPQVAAAVADRPLTLIEPMDAMKKGVTAGVAEEVYKPARAVYEAAGAGKLFQIESQDEHLNTPEHYLDIIRGTRGVS
ncbi:MAG: alpha/beta fold hydrolase [Acidobacteriaceae bacterium]